MVFTPTAYAQLLEADSWFSLHRDRPSALAQEVLSALSLIANFPALGKRTSIENLRRFLLTRTHYALFYIHHDVIRVVAIWHSSRRAPRLTSLL